jgi:glucose-6-phosphate isomerase
MSQHLKLHVDHAGFTPSEADMTAFAQKAQTLPLPAFQQHQPDLEALRHQLESYRKYENIIIIANGGSRTSALAYWQSLRHLRNEVHVEFLSTMEPDVIQELKSRYNVTDTIVMPISKSGTNVDVLEPLMHFLEYPVLPVTSPETGVLYDIAQHYGWDIVPHPEVGGRYSGRTECAFAPAMLMGLDVVAINQAAVNAYASFGYGSINAENRAYLAAAICHYHETKGVTEIFAPIYSQSLAGFLPLLVQLIHESTGKDGKGQTIFGDQAPESQHHTNQRFFGGIQNVMGFFMTVRHQRHANIGTTVPEEIRELTLREGSLSALNGHSLQDALRFDYEGVAENATALKIPHMTLEIDEVTPESMGELLSFMHYFTVYSSLLRDQDPFDQPEVEAAKDLSFQKRLRA